MRIPTQAWTTLLAATQGNLPSTLAELQAFVSHLRRNGHLYEKNPNSLTSANTYYQESYEYDEHVYYDAWSDVPAYFGADDDYESESSCMSNDSEPIDFSDITMLEPNKAGELICWPLT